MRIHPVVSIAQLEPVPFDKDPYQRPRQDELPHVETEDGSEPEYEVERMLDKRYNRRNKDTDFCNFYRRFVRNFSKTVKALVALTRKDVIFVWSPACQEAFELKRKVTEAPILAIMTQKSELIWRLTRSTMSIPKFSRKWEMTVFFTQSPSFQRTFFQSNATMRSIRNC